MNTDKKIIVIQKTFKFIDILDAAEYYNIKFQFGIDIFRRLDTWGSIRTHNVTSALSAAKRSTDEKRFRFNNIVYEEQKSNFRI